MRVVKWDGGRVSTSDSVGVAGPVSGTRLRDSYTEAVRSLTFGIARFDNGTVRIGPLELLRFGEPTVTARSVEWPIQGGLLTGGWGGAWRIESSDGHIEASVGGYRPALPRPLYVLSHLQVHLLFTRLYLLGLRGVEPRPGIPAAPSGRFRAASVDVAFCLTLARFAGRRRLRRTLAIAAIYHVACWSLTGRTLGGLLMRQRVVAVDGSRLTPQQSLLRLALLPLSWIARRPVHDEVACTEVISD